MIKLTFKKDELFKALDYCNSCIEKKHPMVILTNILFSFKDKECTLSATNLEITVIAKVNLEETVNEGKIAVPARSIYDICRLSRADIVTFNYDESNNILDVTTGKSEYKVPCSDPSDFPEISDTTKEYKTINISKFISLYKKVQFSMGEYFSANKTYSGVLITKVKADDGTTSIDMVTTDIHRLSVLKLKNFNVDIDEFENGIVIPGKNFAEITKIFAECSDAQIAIDSDRDEKIFIKKDNVTFISRLFKNEFPKYQSIISSYEVLNSKESAVINRKELIEAIKRVVIVLNTEDKIWTSKYFFKENVLKLTANSNSGGNSVDEIVIEKGFSTERSVAVNAKYFLDVINVIDDNNVNVIVEESPNKAMTIKEEADDFFYIHMVMPLRV
ncbi:DNA polymerase III subunit beta [bacterium]|nr:DNA polymerase III subunit beta [bacterium]